MFKMKKNKTNIENKPKTHIKGEIGVVLGFLVLGFVTVTLVIRLFGMVFYDWHERGNYFLMYTHSELFKLLPEEKEVKKHYFCFGCEHKHNTTIVNLESFLMRGRSDGIVRCLSIGIPTQYKDDEFLIKNDDVIVTIEKGGVFDFWEDYSEDEKNELISIYKSTLIKVSVIESVIIIIRLLINYKLVMLLIKKFKEYRKEDRLGIEPV